MLEIEQELLLIIENCECFYFMGDLNARTGIVHEFQNFDLNHTAAEIYGIDDDVINLSSTSSIMHMNFVTTESHYLENLWIKQKITLEINFCNFVKIITCIYATGDWNRVVQVHLLV